jgi:hypothetical protein
MKAFFARFRWAPALMAALAPVAPTHAQALADVCRPVEEPVVGGWARYRLRGAADSTEMRLALVGVGAWGGAPHVWQESLIPTPAGETVIQSLVPANPYDPTTVRRAIIRAPGQAPVEVPASALAAMKQRAQGTASLDACRTGQAIGWETIDVPAGRLRAMHVQYSREGRTADVWLAPAVPFALVRSIVTGPGATDLVELVLIGHGRNAVPTVPLPPGSPP